MFIISACSLFSHDLQIKNSKWNLQCNFLQKGLRLMNKTSLACSLGKVRGCVLVKL